MHKVALALLLTLGTACGGAMEGPADAAVADLQLVPFAYADVGMLTWKVYARNGITVTPSTGTATPGIPIPVQLKVTKAAQTGAIVDVYAWDAAKHLNVRTSAIALE